MARSFSELDDGRSRLPPSPRDRGRVEQVCVRPALDERFFPEELHLCPRRGAIGDRWEHRTWMYLPDGRPDPRVQLAIAHAPTIAWVHALSGNAHHPGDTLLVDLDLHANNLPAGSRLRVGTAVIEISDVENDGCAKFAARHGSEIRAWMAAPENRTRRLRGVFARVLQEGVVRAGDFAIVVERASAMETPSRRISS